MQHEGIESLVRRRKEDDLVFFETDKSGRMTVDTKNNFASKMEVHVGNGVEVSVSEIEMIEKEMNARAKSWARIVGLGEKWGHSDRVKQAMTSTSGCPPPLCGLPKDHKRVTNGEEHPLRPVCGASVGPGSRISNLLSLIITPCCEEFANTDLVDSTEDLQARLMALNSLRTGRTR